MIKYRSCWVLFLIISLSACAQKSTQPNILFCIADDATWKHMSAYGCTWVQTPAFDRVADQGILFSNAYTPNAKCAPSRSMILTGRNSWQLEEAANHLPFFPTKFKTYPEALAEAGYWVGYTGKGWAPGTAKTEDGKPRELLVRAFNSELFSTKDEDCLVNLASNPEYNEVKERLKSQMESELKKQGDPRIMGNGDIFDNYPPHKGAGFYERYMKGEKVDAGWINKTDFEE